MYCMCLIATKYLSLTLSALWISAMKVFNVTFEKRFLALYTNRVVNVAYRKRIHRMKTNKKRSRLQFVFFYFKEKKSIFLSKCCAIESLLVT